MTNILFFGSSIHSLKIIKALKNYSLVGIVSPSSPVSEYALKNNIPLFEPESLPEKPWELKNQGSLLDFVKKIEPDLIIVCYYGQKIPVEVINFPNFGSLNIHPSLLPNYPGSSPAVWAILKGEKESGVTILKMNEEFDKGKIIAQEKEKITDEDTPETLYERLFTIGANLLIKILPGYLSGKIIPQNQSPRTSCYASRLSRNSGKIDWSKSPEELERFIRAMSPWPSAWIEVEINGQKKRLKILKSHVGARRDAPVLIIDIVQLEGKKPVSFKQFQEGYPTVSINSSSS